MKRQHLYGLDLVRFGSAFLVLLFHLATFSAVTPGFDAPMQDRAFPWLGWVGTSGWVGVEVFFVISGFVIAASAEKSTTRDFLIKRAIRVFPALWICSTVALVAVLAWGMPTGEALNAFFRSIFLSPQGPYIDGVVWTLVVEAAFYLLIAACILFGARLDRPTLDLGGRLLGLASVAFISVYICTAALGLGLAETLMRFPFKVALLWHGVFFALGMLIRKAAKDGLSRTEYGLAALFTVFCLIEIANKVIVTDGGYATEAYRMALALGIWSAAMIVILLSVFRSEWIARFIGFGGVKKAGLMTYPLYLNHFTLGMCLTPWLARYIQNDVMLLLTVSSIILAGAWAIMSGPEVWIQKAARRVLLDGKSSVTIPMPEPILSKRTGESSPP